ncbi:tubulin polyglutamylase TTLL4 isoform X2 [Drosophila grimshawi]|uniref:tubulin polyglutamylase TTLL4 isoform X2 n=1 Tax=Drosophila grimshawi TaxID=7222 RepID=UPI000C870B3B|nr:tubulin polyglutamylase TTLL4 isoform X2 [Drosophila grimshawi]XP_032592137.1 tubulin polyglutamylase TTLL4 isoform X2 [Drosophila grimshawi]
MAQITTEKRTTGTTMRPIHHATPSGASTVIAASASALATKENSRHQATSRGGGKGIEILDFHESWLEEVELYKSKLVMGKQLSQHNHQSSHQSAHNYTNSNSNGPSKRYSTQIRNSAGHSTTPTPTSTRSSQKANQQQQQQKSPTSPRRQKHSDASAANIVTNGTPAAKTAPPRLTTKLNSVPAPVVGVLQSEPYKKVQRAREDVLAKNATNSNGNCYKRPSISTAGTSPPRSGLARSPSATTIKAASKIVVNPFHGSSMLSGQQHDEKSKILTQNGLTKSAATALETSLYASLYAQPTQLPFQCMSTRVASGEHSGNNYMGVSLNKSVNHDCQHSDDDPCGAIDEITSYDDSDSDSDYVGTPFYLDEDNEETSQSRHIRLKLDKVASKTSVATTNTTDTEASVYFKPETILSPSLFPNVPPYLNFTSHADKGPPMPAVLHRVLKWKLSPVMPKIVKRVVLNSGFRIIRNTTDWMAVWEKHMKSPGFRTIRSHQKYNHMPGSFRIGRKDTMWRSIANNMKKFGKKDFGIMQKSYIMPDDLEDLRQVWPKNASKLTKWIVKPPASARGTGIRIVNKWSQFPKDRPLVVQKYIERPLLINDNKFDMRIYVLLTSVNPLRIYMFKDGLARFASVKYSSELGNLDERCMHLTNYSINKFSQNYAKNEDFNACQGHKWTLQSLWSCLENRGVNTKRLWATLRNLVIRGIVSGESGLNRMYRQNVNFRYNCYELFGFDVLLDENLVPWLLEINISPSLHSELPLDLHVKGPLIQAVLNTALYQVPPKLNERQQQEVLDELEMQGPLVHDKRIFTTCLTAEEVRKHNHFTSRAIEYREEYVDTILDNLLPDDVRCLILSEDELARCKPLERIFPTPNSHTFLPYFENARYYNRLLDAWETKYAKNREMGIALLTRFCQDKYHLQVSEAAMEKEPNVALTEIDMLHVKKDEILDNPTNLPPIKAVETNDAALLSASDYIPRSPESATIN